MSFKMRALKDSLFGSSNSQIILTLFIGLTVFQSIAHSTVQGLYLNNRHSDNNSISKNIVKRSPSQLSSQQWMLSLCGLFMSRGNNTNGELGNFCDLSQRYMASSPERACISIPTPKRASISGNQNGQFALTEQLANGISQMKQKSVELDREYAQAVFILGNPGSGKSTLTQILNGNLSELYATKGTANGQMIILDYEGLIMPPTAEAQNVIPNFKMNPESGDAFWDCPSFYGNRSVETDILANYFVKRALDQVSQAKFLFTVPHISVMDENDTADFHLLVTHVTKLLRNPVAHAHSIGLIVTKVAARNSTSNNDDATVLQQVEQFLEKYVKVQSDKMTASENSKEKLSLGKAIQFVQIILNGTRDGSGMPTQRISLVRIPPHCGTLVDMPSFSRAKEMITDLYSKHLKYSTVSSEDFEVTVENNETIDRIAKMYIPETVEVIGQALDTGVNATLKQFFEKFYDQVKSGDVDTPTLLLGSRLTSVKCVASLVSENYNQLMVIGGNVKLSEFLNSTQDNLVSASLHEWPYPCSWDNVKQITIMARDKVTIDYDINGDCKQLQLSIIAPNWEIIGNERQIQLGCSKTPVEYSEDAPAAVGIKDVGKNGQAGLKGFDSGSFFGVFSQVINGEALYINADGGKGGSGQNGGQGYEGQPGENATFERFPGPYSVILLDDIHKGNASENEDSISSVEKNAYYSRIYVNNEWYTFYGEKGKQGGVGGKGGNGGQPGHPGIILLASTSPTGQQPFNISMKTGETGKPGKGGAGGLGGVRGRHISCQSKITWILSWLNDTCFHDTFTLTRAESGDNGTEGGSPSYSLTPLGLFSNRSENWRIINMYKQAFSESIPKPKFIYELNHNSEINDLMTPPTFEQEMEYMEHHGEWKTRAGKTRNQMRENLVFLEDLQQKADIQLETLFATKNISLSTLIVDLSTDVGLSVDKEDCHINLLTELEMQLNFFETVTMANQFAWSSSWLSPLKNLSMEIKSIETFYEFCELLKVDLGSYAKQVLLNELKRNSSLNFENSNTNMLQFLNATGLFPVTYENVTLRGDEEQDKYLVDLLKSQTPNLNLKCEKFSLDKEKHQLVVSGKNVKFSDFLNPAKSPSWPYPCSSKETLKEISIMTQDKLFIDYDLDGDCKKLQVSIIAPNWEIIGDNRMIRLGCSRIQEFVESAAPGLEYGDGGRNGVPGEKGTDSGSFFGVFSNIKNDKALYINADGGKGGTGQHGGRGQEGKPGDSAIYDKFPGIFSATDGVSQGYLDESNTLVDDRAYAVVYAQRWYTLYGEQGKQGGKGGDGGNGGLPGHPGSIVLISSSVQSKKNVQTSMKDGLGGEPGVGGAGGIGGKSGDHMSCKMALSVVGFWWTGCYNTSSISRGETGETGRTGSTPQYNKSSRPSDKYETWRFINAYKQKYFETSTKKSKFMNELDYNREIVSLMTPLSFAEELEAVEQSYWRTSGSGTKSQKRAEGKFFTFYEDFLARLRNYAKQRMESNNNSSLSSGSRNNLSSSKPIMTKGERIALNYIYAATLGKMIGMRQNMNTLNVINTKDYFDAISRQLDLLRQSQKENAIADESLRYKEKLNEKTNEAMNFITGTVQPALDNAEKVMEEQNDKMFKEINEYIRTAEDNLEKQKQIKRDFQNTLPLRNLMAGLKVVGAVCQFCGPWGKVAGTAISGVTSIAEPLLLDEFPSQKQSNVPFDKVSGDFLSMIRDRNDKYYDRKMENIQEQIKRVEEAIEKEGLEPQSLGELNVKIENAKNAMEELKQAKSSDEGSPDPVNFIGKEMNFDAATKDLEESAASASSNLEEGEEEVDTNEEANSENTDGETSTTTSTLAPPSKEDELKFKLKKKRENKLKANKKISIFGKSLKVAGTGINLWQGINQQNNELERLDKIIEDADKSVKEREMYKEVLYKEFLPKLATATGDIKGQREDLHGQSSAGLTVKKWKLKD